MDIKIIPSKLSGELDIPSSKSMTHRMLISAALADGESVISNITFSQDIHATINALCAVGTEISVKGNSAFVKGVGSHFLNRAEIDCFESGSTLRFMIPVVSALGISAVYKGKGRLPQRPITPYLRELSKKGITFDYNNTMPFETKGKLEGGIFELEGNVSSQFITGLLFALPLLEKDSEIILTSKLESKPYADMTIDCINKFGINIEETKNGYFIKGSQKYLPLSSAVEGDYSQAAFFYVANALGSNVKINNLNPQSKQGDKKIVEIVDNLCYNNIKSEGFDIDASDIPDLVPVLGVLGTFLEKKSRIYNAARLKIKESDRLLETARAINALGGNVIPGDDGLIIEHANLKGGTVYSAGDHRIVMSAAVAATVCSEPVIIKNAEAVEKSYPDFFRDYTKLGGIANVINME